MTNSHSGNRILAVMIVGIAACVTPSAEGQTVRRKPRTASAAEGKTTVSIVLVTGDNTAAFRARSWRTTLEKLNVPFRIRSGTGADKLEIRETKLGPLRKVMVVGKIDRSGRMIFADRTFTRADSAKLAEWIRELKTYGKQGEPRGKPLWGLSKSQFGALFADLSTPVAVAIHGKELPQAVARLRLPAKYTVRYTVAARKSIRTKPGDFKPLYQSKKGPDSGTVRMHVKGQSLGTAFALVLRDFGLGFRPLRSPAGDIEFVIDPLADAKDAWPVGWKPSKSRPATAPMLFKIAPQSFDKMKLLDVFDTVAAKSGVPIHIDRHAIAAKGINLDKLVVSYPARKASFSLLLRGITTRSKLSYILRIDEAGQPFAWITTWTPGSREE